MSEFDAKAFLKAVSTRPGVYRMHNARGEIIYVGKAKNLKNRLTSYFSGKAKPTKVIALVNHIAHVEVTVTQNELEALLLEITLIKKHRPRYNVLFRDDKSYPYIHLTDHPFPRMVSYRGAKPKRGRIFGPYPNGSSVRETIHLMHKVFQLRQCEDSVFAHRTRPCLQHQIKRCSAPCVGLISESDYQHDIESAVAFLGGKSQSVTDNLVQKMHQASEQLDYEKAAYFRDQITALRELQREQSVTTSSTTHADVIAIKQLADWVCVQVVFVREGRVLGNKAFFSQMNMEMALPEVLSQFVAQYYLSGQGKAMMPQTLVLADRYPLAEEVQTALVSQAPQLHIVTSLRGHKSRWAKLAQLNAEQALMSKCGKEQQAIADMAALRAALQISTTIHRIECFDISHTQGEATVASCVVHTEKGMTNRDYRRFNIKDIQAGDDYAAMHQALTRRYSRLLKEDKPLPELVLIDGGKGQLSQAEQVFEELGVNDVYLLGVSKGPERKSGEETLWLSGRELPVGLPGDNPAHLLIQRIRDEAHRFAITGHRKQRSQSRLVSPLQNIPGVGERRRQALLNYFGGWQELKAASVEDIAKVAGISKSLAASIHQYLHA